MTPDNILVFKRNDTERFRPYGVISNYHHRFELLVVLQRPGPVHVGETGYLLEPGEAVLIFPHQFHHYMDVEKGAMEWLFITFEVEDATPVESLRDAPKRLDAKLLAWLAEAVREYDCLGEGGSPLFIAAPLARCLLGMTEAAPIPEERRNLHSGDGTRDQILRKISEYVGQHLSETPNLATLAAALNYSESHLRTVFREQLGVSLGRYLRNSRLSEAAKLLQVGDGSIAEVARRCGFDSHVSFSRTFKQAFGVPPKEYGRRLRGEAPGDHSLPSS